jgi:Mg2+ and Co2+ transporter CorA
LKNIRKGESTITNMELDLVNFLLKKVYHCEERLESSRAYLDFSLQNYDKNIDRDIYISGEELNKIMTIFSVISILFLPPATVGGIMGMNVRLPF